jgi:hypothetical protein
MARSEHLPIYKKAMEIALYFEQIVRNFSRYNKYTIGSDLRLPIIHLLNIHPLNTRPLIGF